MAYKKRFSTVNTTGQLSPIQETIATAEHGMAPGSITNLQVAGTMMRLGIKTT